MIMGQSFESLGNRRGARPLVRRTEEMMMSADSNNDREKRDVEDMRDVDSGALKPTDGQIANGGEQAGPASDDAGRPIEPQTGEPIDHAH
jgi:hypothetical protein